MARPLRIEFDGALYHLTCPGNDRKAIFKDDTGRQLFLSTLAEVVLPPVFTSNATRAGFALVTV